MAENTEQKLAKRSYFDQKNLALLEKEYSEKINDFSKVNSLTSLSSTVLGLLVFVTTGMGSFASIFLGVLFFLVSIPLFFTIFIRIYKFVPLPGGVECGIQYNSGKIVLSRRVMHLVPSWLPYWGIARIYPIPTTVIRVVAESRGITYIGEANVTIEKEVTINRDRILDIITSYDTIDDLIANAERTLREGLEQIISFDTLNAINAEVTDDESKDGTEAEKAKDSRVEDSFKKVYQLIQNPREVSRRLYEAIIKRAEAAKESGEGGIQNAFTEGFLIYTETLPETQISGTAVDALKHRASLRGAIGVEIENLKLQEVQKVAAKNSAQIEKASDYEQVRVDKENMDNVTLPHLQGIKGNIKTAGENRIPYFPEGVSTAVAATGGGVPLGMNISTDADDKTPDDRNIIGDEQQPAQEH